MSSNSLLTLEADIKSAVLSFIQTAYSTNDPDFDSAREQFLTDVDTSPMFRSVLFEFIRRYRTSNQPLNLELRNVLKAKAPHLSDQNLDQLVGVFEQLMVEFPFIHQMQAIDAAVNRNRHVVVTTGTGSGKTFCFLIPMLLNIFLEAIGDASRKRWDGQGKIFGSKWWREQRLKYYPYRQSRRTSAIRALLVYPLNALVQDQIETLRSILNSDAASCFYNSVLGLERVFFGQYNSMTEGMGSPTNERELNHCVDFLRKVEKESAEVDPADVSYVPQVASSEMLLRWDMQETPPDILITNFTMLAIMLIRTQESAIFSSTRKWLSEDPKNIFYLVLDELHSYRGTGGTEISYTIRQFLERIGLHAAHPQLRIICTSASLEGGESTSRQDPQFLSDFFGTPSDNQLFEMISGELIPYARTELTLLSALKNDFIDYGRSGSSLASQSIAAELSKYQDYDLDTNKPGILENLLYSLECETAMNIAQGLTLSNTPFSLNDLAARAFEGNIEAAIGFFRFVVEHDSDGLAFKGKLRQHLFVKNLQGIRRAMEIQDGTLSSMRLESETASYSITGRAIALDSLYCQVCGELYYRGFMSKVENRTYVSSDILPSTRHYFRDFSPI